MPDAAVPQKHSGPRLDGPSLEVVDVLGLPSAPFALEAGSLSRFSHTFKRHGRDFLCITPVSSRYRAIALMQAAFRPFAEEGSPPGKQSS